MEKNGEPKTVSDLAGHRLVHHSVYRSDRDVAWQDVIDAGAVVGFQSNSSLAQLSAIRAGLGIALLPVYLGGEFPDLVPLLETRLWPSVKSGSSRIPMFARTRRSVWSSMRWRNC